MLYTSAYPYSAYWYRIGEQKAIVFQVQACGNAYVGLFNQHQAELSYEFLIGGNSNTRSSISRQLEIKHEVSLIH